MAKVIIDLEEYIEEKRELKGLKEKSFVFSVTHYDHGSLQTGEIIPDEVIAKLLKEKDEIAREYQKEIEDLRLKIRLSEMNIDNRTLIQRILNKKQ